MAVTLATWNAKGGVTKTTTSVNVAAGLARRGLRVLLVDADPQGDASMSVGLQWEDLSPSLADVLLPNDGGATAPALTAIRETAVPGLSVLPANLFDLLGADLRLADLPGRETKLRDALQPVQARFDWIIIDCQPTLSLLVVNALVAADFFLVPVIPQYLPTKGLVAILDVVDRTRDGIGRCADLLGIVLSHVDVTAGLSRRIAEEIRSGFPDHVFDTQVRKNVRVAEAAGAGIPIFDYDPHSTGAIAYDGLTNEILVRAGARTAR